MSLQDVMKSPEVKKKIQHVTWPWPLIACTELSLWMKDVSPSTKMSFSAACAVHHHPSGNPFACVSRPPQWFEVWKLTGQVAALEFIPLLRIQAPMLLSTALSALTIKEQQLPWSPTHWELDKTSNTTLVCELLIKESLLLSRVFFGGVFLIRRYLYLFVEL